MLTDFIDIGGKSQNKNGEIQQVSVVNSYGSFKGWDFFHTTIFKLVVVVVVADCLLYCALSCA